MMQIFMYIYMYICVCVHIISPTKTNSCTMENQKAGDIDNICNASNQKCLNSYLLHMLIPS